MVLFSIAILISYVWLIKELMLQWEKSKANKVSFNFIPNLSISVIIIARNEENNIIPCIQSILKNDFPYHHFEIIIVDDHSEDSTILKIKSIRDERIKILSLEDYTGEKKINAFKKAGIKYALENAKYNYILHTDADCIVPNNWLKKTAFNFQNGINFQAAPITYYPVTTFLHWFQQLDMYTLMASTNAGIQSKNWYLANGANLAYHKPSLPANIYSESDKHASGDDVYLINQMAKINENTIHFEPDIIIKTKPINKIQKFLNQRIRWAGKNKNLAKGKMKNILVIPVLTNLWVFILIAYFFIDPQLAISCLLFFVMIKWMIDYLLLNYMQKELNPTQKNKYFMLSSFCYPAYIIGIGIVSFLTKSYVWKSRRVK